MGLIFKIRMGSNGIGFRNRGQRSVGWLAKCSVQRLHWIFAPVPGGVSCRRPQSRQSQQIVSARHEVAPGLRPFQSPIPTSPQSAHRLDPADDFFHSFPYPLARGVTPLAGGAPIQAVYFYSRLAGHMGYNFPLAAPVDKLFLVIVLVRPDGLGGDAPVQLGVSVQLPQGHDRFGFADGIMQREVGTQTLPVLHQQVRAETQLGLPAIGLPIQNAVAIARALMRVIAALFPAKIHRGVAGVFVPGRADFLGIRPVLPNETFQARPRFDQGAVGGEVFVARPAFLPREVIDFGKEEFRHVGGKHPLVILGKDAVVETAFTELPVEEPKPEQIVAELVAEEPLAADAVKGGQHAGLKQLFRRDAATTILGIEIIEERRKFAQDGVDLPLDGTERMVRRHALVEIDNRQKVRLGLRFSTHEFQTHRHLSRSNVFQQPASGQQPPHDCRSRGDCGPLP